MFGISKTKIETDGSKVDELLERGIENIFPSKEFLKKRLMAGEKLTVYLGIDPTGSTLHLGHVICMLRLGRLQELGHQIILLMGDFTAMIGDPTDKSSSRKQLSHEEVMKNLKEYKRQASKFIKFDGENPALFKFNSEWLGKMNFFEVLSLASNATVEQMMKRDMFRRREEEGGSVYIHELMYPLMQGYDSVAMDVDGEIGGNDQTFNMLVGRDLLKSMKNKEKFVIATKLLVDASGHKMGKTEGNMVALDQSPEDMFGRIMSWSDDLMLHAFEIATNIPMREIEQIKESLQSGGNPKEVKMRLAREIVKMCYDEQAAEAAERNFENTFSKGEFPPDALVIEASGTSKIMDVLVDQKVVESKSEFRRLVEAGAVSDYPDKKITDPNEVLGDKQRKIKIGKKTFIILEPS